MGAIHHKPSKGHRDRQFLPSSLTKIEEYISRVQKLNFLRWGTEFFLGPTSVWRTMAFPLVEKSTGRTGREISCHGTNLRYSKSFAHSAEAVAGQMSALIIVVGNRDQRFSDRDWRFLCRFERKVRTINFQPIIHMVGIHKNVPTHIH